MELASLVIGSEFPCPEPPNSVASLLKTTSYTAMISERQSDNPDVQQV